jgi:hypothetical protein
VDESDCAYVQRRLVHLGRPSAVGLQALRSPPVVVVAPPAYPVCYARPYCPPTTLELGYGPLGRLPGAWSLALMAGADRTFKPEATVFVFLPLPRGG